MFFLERTFVKFVCFIFLVILAPSCHSTQNSSAEEEENQQQNDMAAIVKTSEDHPGLTRPDTVAEPDGGQKISSNDASTVSETKSPEPELSDIAKLHKEAIVIDAHNDFPLRMIDDEGYDFAKRGSGRHTDLPRMIEGGLDAQFLSVWVHPKRYGPEKAWKRTMDMFDTIDRVAKKNKSHVDIVTTSEEIRQTHKEGKIAFLIGVEGAHALGKLKAPEDALKRIRIMYDRGARYLTLTWMNSNDLGGSSGDGKNKGLTKLGRRAVRLMNEIGMIVDVSHVSDPTFFDVLEETKLPVIASHSGVRTVFDHFRNITDEMLKAIAKNDGAACIVFYPGYLDADWNAARRLIRKAGDPVDAEPVPISKVMEHIDHAVKVAGIDHVCLGSDFDGIRYSPSGLEDTSKYPNLTKELKKRGYSDEDVRKILGENVLRVMAANEKAARENRRPSRQ